MKLTQTKSTFYLATAQKSISKKKKPKQLIWRHAMPLTVKKLRCIGMMKLRNPYYRRICYSKWSYSTLKKLSITTWCVRDGVNSARRLSCFNLCSKRSRNYEFEIKQEIEDDAILHKSMCWDRLHWWRSPIRFQPNNRPLFVSRYIKEQKVCRISLIEVQLKISCQRKQWRNLGWWMYYCEVA